MMFSAKPSRQQADRELVADRPDEGQSAPSIAKGAGYVAHS